MTQLVEQNPTLLRLGLHLEFNDARHRVAAHLQRNIDRSKYIKNIAKIYNIYQRIIVHGLVFYKTKLLFNTISRHKRVSFIKMINY